MTVGSGLTQCGAFFSSRLRSSVDWATRRELAGLQVFQAAVDQARGRGAGAGAEIGLVDDQAA